VRSIASSFANPSTTPVTNFSSSDYFTLVDPRPDGTLPPAGPVAQLSGPSNGEAISVAEINGRKYIDVTFNTRSGSLINPATINGDEFTLSGAITSDLKMLPGSIFRSLVIARSEEHTSELQSRSDLVCRLLLEKKKQ